MVDLEVLQKQLADVQKALSEATAAKEAVTEKAPATTSNFTPLHGQAGIWNIRGLDPNIVATIVRPYDSIAFHVPFLPSVYTDPRFGALTGVTATTGSEPSVVCADAPTAYDKSCTLTAKFGRLVRDTRDIMIADVMMRYNRGDFTDLNLINENIRKTVAPNGLNSTDDILNVVTANEMFIVAINVERKLVPMFWQGSIANNVGQGYWECPGLDSQIATGQVDAETNTACPALDSDVKDFNWQLVDVGDIVDYVSALEYYLTSKAEDQGANVNWAFVMRRQLFFELCAVWPCSYLTSKCKNSPGLTGAVTTPMVINDNVNASMRWDMWNRHVLIVNGKEYPVILDPGIKEYDPKDNANVLPGQYASSIYFVPLTMNGMTVTYREHVDYTKAGVDMAHFTQGNPHCWPTDNGAYFWGYVDTEAFCYKLKCLTEQRIILRTPQYAGKIQRVRYQPRQHEADMDPGSSYHKDGGVSIRGISDTYAVWR